MDLIPMAFNMFNQGMAAQVSQLLLKVDSGTRQQLLVARDPNGNSLLHFAAFHNSLQTLKVLIEYGAEVDARAHNLQTPLMWACVGGRIEAVLALLASGADLNAKDNLGAYALLLALQGGHRLLFLLLMDLGASPVEVDSRGASCAHWAAYKGNVALLRLLHKRRLPMNEFDFEGLTPLHRAALAGRLDAATFLIETCRVPATTRTRPPFAINPPPAAALLQAGLPVGPGTWYTAFELALVAAMAAAPAAGQDGPGGTPASMGISTQAFLPPRDCSPPATAKAALEKVGMYLSMAPSKVPDWYHHLLQVLPTAPPRALLRLRVLQLRADTGAAGALAAAAMPRAELPQWWRLDLLVAALLAVAAQFFSVQLPTEKKVAQHGIIWLVSAMFLFSCLQVYTQDAGDLPVGAGWLTALHAACALGIVASELAMLYTNPGVVDPYGVRSASQGQAPVGDLDWEALPSGPEQVLRCGQSGSLHMAAIGTDGSLLDPVDSTVKPGRAALQDSAVMVDPSRIQAHKDGLVSLANPQRGGSVAPPPHATSFMMLQFIPVNGHARTVAAAQLLNVLLAIGNALARASVRLLDDEADLTGQEWDPDAFTPHLPQARVQVAGAGSSAPRVLRALLRGEVAAQPPADRTASSSPPFLSMPPVTLYTTWSATAQVLLQRPLSHIERLVLDCTFMGGGSSRPREDFMCLTSECPLVPRSKHDTFTDARYEKFDHFCPWTYQVIAKDTHPFFIAYCFAMCVGCSCCIIMHVINMWSAPLDSPASFLGWTWAITVGRGIVPWLSFACAAFGAVLTGNLLVFHVPYAMAQNITTNEVMGLQRYHHFLSLAGPSGTPIPPSSVPGIPPGTPAQVQAFIGHLAQRMPALAVSYFNPFSWDSTVHNVMQFLGLRGPRRLTAGRLAGIAGKNEVLLVVRDAQLRARGLQRQGCQSSCCDHSHGTVAATDQGEDFAGRADAQPGPVQGAPPATLAVGAAT